MHAIAIFFSFPWNHGNGWQGCASLSANRRRGQRGWKKTAGTEEMVVRAFFFFFFFTSLFFLFLSWWYVPRLTLHITECLVAGKEIIGFGSIISVRILCRGWFFRSQCLLYLALRLWTFRFSSCDHEVTWQGCVCRPCERLKLLNEFHWTKSGVSLCNIWAPLLYLAGSRRKNRCKLFSFMCMWVRGHGKMSGI